MKLIVSALLALAFAAPAQAWKSNEFVSPTGNIHCEIVPQGAGWWDGITCRQRQTKKQVAVMLKGRAFRTSGWPVPKVSYDHVLNYGMTYDAKPFFCRSFTVQMVCGNRNTGHGFAISREGMRTW